MSRSSRPRCRREGLRLSQGEPRAHCVESTSDRAERRSSPGGSHRSLKFSRPSIVRSSHADERIKELGRNDPVVRRLMTAPGVGPVTALAFVASLDEVTRFRGAHQVESYLGLVPSEYSSGERQHRGRITKRGKARMRSLSGRGGVADHAIETERVRCSQSLGNADRRSAREADRSGRARQAALRDSLRDVARRK